MSSLLFGLVAYVLCWLFWNRLRRRFPRLVRDLQVWALPATTVLLILGLWMVIL
jgi:hypothetical protein